MNYKSNTQSAKHLIVMSIDALSEDNWEMCQSLPNFSTLIKKGAYSNELKSVFPTLTYVVHTTMVTGVYPNKHGIIHNNPFQPFVPEKDQLWYWYQKDIKVPTIYDLARKNKLKTAGLLWPVTANSSIKYNLPEIKAIKNENQALKVLKNGNKLYCLDLELRLGKHREGIKQPSLDDYTTMCVVDTIKKKKPNLFQIHLIDLDDAKHNNGTNNEEVQKALLRMDGRIGQIIQAVKDAKIENDTIFLLIGDHGQLDVKHKVYLNNILKEKGLINEKNGKTRWRAYFQSTGGSAYLYIKEGDIEAEEIVTNILQELQVVDKFGIEKVYDREALDLLNADKSIKYGVEAKEGYCFQDEIAGKNIVNCKDENIKYATHGYSPDKPNYKCVFIVSGSNIKENYNIGPIEMVDIAPTMAKILGLKFYPCDGKVLEEIFTMK
ncbi:putative AlkP superfamily pyrophosphatase or phosphodiesterase [Natranaerovirga pectinivora]|uniref:Putative AlkP superfamily pyrophosphatase or phosphodiesterase n=1 Tax=Natranaerovirga pectinivora TaxID=682400 RepID=A0A4R3MSL9_9FIRM|nr:ectonucleotide pyrophosphatase/phosphodiesterase [Natranaerovirga pectinivora]TCT16024.1 putative AlkP superfamily pyrophosphatase or phosphodiesterase [Natranaerovirga pectinivora]